MAYIRTKNVKGHEYQYLVESIRIGSNVIQKHIKYMGDGSLKPQNKVSGKYGFLTDSEYIGVENWPLPLKRRKRGCDFKQINDGSYVEFKTNTFSTLQRKDFDNQFKNGYNSIFAEIGPDNIMVFKLIDIIDINNKDRMELGALFNTPPLEQYDKGNI